LRIHGYAELGINTYPQPTPACRVYAAASRLPSP
jgi:hypothetical protein